jgi:hypothetical protein
LGLHPERTEEGTFHPAPKPRLPRKSAHMRSLFALVAREEHGERAASRPKIK